MEGTSTTEFNPALATSRGMLVTILWRLEGQPTAAESGYIDLTQDWYKNAVDWAAANKIATGCNATHFCPDENITREQLAAILYRYAMYKGYDVSVGEDTNILSYEDTFSISEYAIPALQWACGAGLIEGGSNSLYPQNLATRAEVATILMRFLEGVNK
jgi:hypothetical protein